MPEERLRSNSKKCGCQINESDMGALVFVHLIESYYLFIRQIQMMCLNVAIFIQLGFECEIVNLSTCAFLLLY